MDYSRTQQPLYYETVEPYLSHGSLSGNREYLAQILKTWSPEIDPHNDIGWALQAAIFQGDDSAVQMIIDAGVSPTLQETQDPGFTPLLAASQYGRLQVAELLWQLVGPEGRFFPSRTIRPNQLTCLRVAARNNHADLTGYFLDKWDGWGDEKRRALHDAASAWCEKSVTLLLSKVSFETKEIQDSLERAVRKRMILPENETKPMPTAEDHSCQQRLVCRLIDAGANPNGEDSYNRWPLIHIASLSRDCVGALKGLLGKGANPNRQDHHGKTALHRLFTRSNQYRPEDNTLQILLQHGALPELADRTGETPFHAISRMGTYEQLQLCLSHCRAPDAESAKLQNSHGESLLHYAAAGGKGDIIDFLLRSGLDVNMVNKNGWTPLMCALAPTKEKTTRCTYQTAKSLILRGASARVVTDEGWTPLHAMASWPIIEGLEMRAEVANLAQQLISGGAPIDVRSRVISNPTTTAASIYNIWGFRMCEFVENADTLLQEDMGPADNTTPLIWASRENATDIVDAITAHLICTNIKGAA